MLYGYSTAKVQKFAELCKFPKINHFVFLMITGSYRTYPFGVIYRSVLKIVAQIFFIRSLSFMIARKAFSPSTFRFECSHSRIYPPSAYFSSMCWYARSKCHSKSASGCCFMPNCNARLRMVSGSICRSASATMAP